MTAVVKAESLTKRFGGVPAVTDLSFAVEAGTITGFLGPNGAGKTTTLRMILGLLAIDADIFADIAEREPTDAGIVHALQQAGARDPEQAAFDPIRLNEELHGGGS